MADSVQNKVMGKSVNIYFFKARFRIKSFPKQVGQTSPLITFYTHGILTLIFVSSLFLVAHVLQFEMGGVENGGRGGEINSLLTW